MVEKINFDLLLNNFSCSLFFSFCNTLDITVFFIVVKKSKNKLIYFYFLIFIFLGNSPKNMDTNNFLGFFSKVSKIMFFNFVLLYLPILTVLLENKVNFLNKKAFFVFNDFPFIYELDNISGKNSNVIDYFPYYKMVFFFKFKSNKILFNEFLIRSFLKIPVYFKYKTL